MERRPLGDFPQPALNGGGKPVDNRVDRQWEGRLDPGEIRPSSAIARRPRSACAGCVHRVMNGLSPGGNVALSASKVFGIFALIHEVSRLSTVRGPLFE